MICIIPLCHAWRCVAAGCGQEPQLLLVVQLCACEGSNVWWRVYIAVWGRDGQRCEKHFMSLEFSAGRSDVLRRQLLYSCAIIRATRTWKVQTIQGKKRIKKLERRREPTLQPTVHFPCQWCQFSGPQGVAKLTRKKKVYTLSHTHTHIYIYLYYINIYILYIYIQSIIYIYINTRTHTHIRITHNHSNWGANRFETKSSALSAYCLRSQRVEALSLPAACSFKICLRASWGVLETAVQLANCHFAWEMSSPKRCLPLKPHQHLFWSSCWLQPPTLQSPQDQPERISQGDAVRRAAMRPSCFPLEREKTNPTLNQLLAQQPLAALLRKQEHHCNPFLLKSMAYGSCRFTQSTLNKAQRSSVQLGQSFERSRQMLGLQSSRLVLFPVLYTPEFHGKFNKDLNNARSYKVDRPVKPIFGLSVVPWKTEDYSWKGQRIRKTFKNSQYIVRRYASPVLASWQLVWSYYRIGQDEDIHTSMHLSPTSSLSVVGLHWAFHVNCSSLQRFWVRRRLSSFACDVGTLLLENHTIQWASRRPPQMF